MATIATPAQAKTIDDLTPSQYDLVRQSLGINDDPLKTDKTYILFEATAGNNNLYLNTGVSSTYIILKGDGTVFTSYTDTGGVKVLNYVDAGRYLITIEGVFYGINAGAAIQADKDKYISVISGSNYPTTIVDDAFLGCSNLESIYLKYITAIGANSFELCTKLSEIILAACASVGAESFKSSTKIKLFVVDYNASFAVGSDAFGSVILNNLVVNSSTLAQAKEIRTKMAVENGQFSCEFQLYSNDVRADTLSLNERLIQLGILYVPYKTDASGLPSTTGAGNIDLDRVNNYSSQTPITADVIWGLIGSVGGIRAGRRIVIEVKPSTFDIQIIQAGIVIKGDISNSYIQLLDDPTTSYFIILEVLTPTLVWVKVRQIYNGEVISYEFLEPPIEIAFDFGVSDYYKQIVVTPNERKSKCNLRVNIDYDGVIIGTADPRAFIKYQLNGTDGGWTDLLDTTAVGAFSGSVIIDLDKDDTLFLRSRIEVGSASIDDDDVTLNITLVVGEFVGNCKGSFSIGAVNTFNQNKLSP